MRFVSLFIILNITIVQCSRGQSNDRVAIVMVENDRIELQKALNFLKLSGPKLMSVNLNLDCANNSSDQELRATFDNIDLLVLPSEVEPFGTNQYMDIIPCSLIYPKGVKTGYTNLISSESEENLIDRVQLKNSFGKRERYHLAVNIAFSLDEDKARGFIGTHPDTIAIDLRRDRTFKTYHINDFYDKKENADLLHGKVVILSAFPYDYLTVRKKGNELVNMSTSEIFANIACQIVGE